MGFFLLQALPANAAAVDYQRRPVEHDFRKYEPRDYDPRDYDPRARESYGRGYDTSRDSSYKQPAYTQQELQKIKNEILKNLARDVGKLSQKKGFDSNIAEYIKILTDIMKKISASSLPFRAELLSMLEGHKNAVMKSANESYFLSEKIIFDNLGNDGESAEESSIQKAFRNGMRMSEDSFDLLRRMSSQVRERAKFERDYLKILIIQLLNDNHSRCGARRQCLAQDEKLMLDFKGVLPASLQFGAIIAKYIKDLKEKSSKQSVLPIILKEIQNEMDPAEWEALLQSDPILAEEIVSDEVEWAEITKQDPDGETIYPWTDPAAEQAEQAKKKAEADKKGQHNAAERDKNKSTVEKKTEELKGKAADKGKEIAQNLISGLLGGGKDKGGGTASQALKGLFG